MSESKLGGAPKNAPDFVAYSVRDRGEHEKAAWNQVGVAWVHGDRKGINIKLDATPVDGEITLREYVDRAHENREQASDQSQERGRGRSR